MTPGQFLLNLTVTVALSLGAVFLLFSTLLKPSLISPLAEDSKKLGGKEPSYYLDLANHFGTLDESQVVIDLSAYQKRVNGECSSGQAIRVIDEEGEVTCEQVSLVSGQSTGGSGVTSLTGGGGVTVNGTQGIPKTGALTLSTSGIPYSSLSLGNSIVTGDIKDATITGADLADSIVTSAKIADGTITNADISSSAAIAYSKLALANSITSGDLADGTITGADLASNISISTTGNLATTGSGTLSIAGSSTLTATTLTSLTTTTGNLTSTVSDSSSAVGFTLTTSSLTTAGAKLLSIKNNTTEELSIDKDGNLTLNGNLVSTGTLQGTQLISTVSTGTAPLVVSSTTQVANLNASLLGGFTAAQLTGNLYNYLTNPGFEIWQRGAGPFTAGQAYNADRWQGNQTGGDTLSISREGTIKESDSRYSAAATFTLSAGAGASQFMQRLVLNGDNEFLATGLSGRQLTFRIRVRANAASAVRAFIFDGTTTTYSGFHSGAAAFESLDVTATMGANPSEVRVGVVFAATVTAYLDNATLVLGSTAQTYYPLHPAEEWARAQRYYWKTSGVTLFPQVTGNATAGGQTWTTNILFPVPMAVVPTLTKAGTWEVSNMAQPTVDAPSVEGFRLNGTSSAAGFLYSRPDSTDDILTAEANP